VSFPFQAVSPEMVNSIMSAFFADAINFVTFVFVTKSTLLINVLSVKNTNTPHTIQLYDLCKSGIKSIFNKYNIKYQNNNPQFTNPP